MSYPSGRFLRGRLRGRKRRAFDTARCWNVPPLGYHRLWVGHRYRPRLRVTRPVIAILPPILPQNTHHCIDPFSGNGRCLLSSTEHSTSIKDLFFPLHSQDVIPVEADINEQSNSRHEDMMHHRPEGRAVRLETRLVFIHDALHLQHPARGLERNYMGI